MLSQVPNVRNVKSESDVKLYAEKLISWYGSRSLIVAKFSADDGEANVEERTTWQRIHEAVTRLQGSQT